MEVGEPPMEGTSPSKTPFTLPRFDPLSPDVAVGSSLTARLKVCLARLELENREKAHTRQLEQELKIRRVEIEAEKEIKIRQLELDAGRLVPTLAQQHPGVGVSSTTVNPPRTFDVSKHIALVPPLRETEVDSYFGAFERVAAALQWPREVWPLLLQCRLSEKAQEVMSALSLADS